MISLCQRDYSFTQRWKIHVFWDATLCRGYVSGVSKDRTVFIFVAALSKKKYFFTNFRFGLPGRGDEGAAVFLQAGRLCNITGQ
jgi:hypothetical protein